MQFRRRHCCIRAVVVLLVLAVVALLILIYRSRRSPAPAHTPAPANAPANTPAPTNAPATPGVTLRARPRSNGTLGEEVDPGPTLRAEPYPYLHNPEDKCRSRSPFLVLMVTAKPEDRAARDAIRQTWGHEDAGGGPEVVRIFLLGVKAGGARPDPLRDAIGEESRAFGDIVQQEYEDTYHNLTLKTLMGMHWVATYCANASYVMKVDSDMFVHTENLVRTLLRPEAPPRAAYFTGYLMRGYRPNRDPRSKWYMPAALYGAEVYPDFCSGTAYVFSAELAARIYGASVAVRRLHLEDVFVGVCLARLGVVPAAPPNDSLFNHWRVSFSVCLYSRIITAHGFRPNELIIYWRRLKESQHPCR